MAEFYGYVLPMEYCDTMVFRQDVSVKLDDIGTNIDVKPVFCFY